MFKTILLTLLVTTQFAFANNHPKTVAELKETSVRIMNLEMNSGGTGVIFRSFTNATHILTNKHVCHLIEPGGIVDYKGKQYLVTHYKKFPDHDLCLVRINTNLNINTDVSDSVAKESSKSIVSGHPSLLPHIATVGHLSEKKEIEILAGVKPCTDEDMKTDPEMCLFLGGKPIIQKFNAQLVSNLIKPGNSGSGVFNAEGKIIGVVFAGDSRDFSFGFIVPQLYILYFIENAQFFNWVKVGTIVDNEGMSERTFNFKNCLKVELSDDDKFKTIRDFCKSVNDTLIWSK